MYVVGWGLKRRRAGAGETQAHSLKVHIYLHTKYISCYCIRTFQVKASQSCLQALRGSVFIGAGVGSNHLPWLRCWRRAEQHE